MQIELLQSNAQHNIIQNVEDIREYYNVNEDGMIRN